MECEGIWENWSNQEAEDYCLGKLKNGEPINTVAANMLDKLLAKDTSGWFFSNLIIILK